MNIFLLMKFQIKIVMVKCSILKNINVLIRNLENTEKYNTRVTQRMK